MLMLSFAQIISRLSTRHSAVTCKGAAHLNSPARRPHRSQRLTVSKSTHNQCPHALRIFTAIPRSSVTHSASRELLSEVRVGLLQEQSIVCGASSTHRGRRRCPGPQFPSPSTTAALLTHDTNAWQVHSSSLRVASLFIDSVQAISHPHQVCCSHASHHLFAANRSSSPSLAHRRK
jgi:hypothetical protein